MTFTAQDLYYIGAFTALAYGAVKGAAYLRPKSKLAKELKTQREASELKEIALDAAKEAVAVLKESQAQLEKRVETLENKHRSLLFYYHLTLNYCARLLDHIHDIRGLFAQHQPGVNLPDIPVKPAQLTDVRAKYEDLDEVEYLNYPRKH